MAKQKKAARTAPRKNALPLVAAALGAPGAHASTAISVTKAARENGRKSGKGRRRNEAPSGVWVVVECKSGMPVSRQMFLAKDKADLFAAELTGKGKVMACAVPMTVDDRRPNPVPSYKAAHWGDEPEKTVMAAVPDPRVNKGMTGLGELVSVCYATTKGGESAEWEHEFSKPRPVLAYGKTDGKLYVVGGGYHISDRGIVK